MLRTGLLSGCLPFTAQPDVERGHLAPHTRSNSMVQGLPRSHGPTLLGGWDHLGPDTASPTGVPRDLGGTRTKCIADLWCNTVALGLRVVNYVTV